MRCWLALLLLLSFTAEARWYLDNESSRISFVTSHDTQRAEVGRFLKLHGLIEEAGQVLLRVELETVSSGHAQRDSILREQLFDIRRFPEARIVAELDITRFMPLADGAQQEVRLPIELTLLGRTLRLETELLVTRLDALRFQIVTLAPLVLPLQDLGLSATITALAEHGDVRNINLAVPVSAVLIFTRR